jgi:maltose-binding protein MalE
MFRWIQATSFLVFALAAITLVAGPGCTPPKNKEQPKAKDAADKDKAKDKHDHEEYGPHGGPLADWDDKFHGEVTLDNASKMVIVYVLDGKAEKAPDIDASRITKMKLVIPADKVELDLMHDAKKSGKEGIVFTGAHDFFAKSGSFTGNLSMVVDEGKKNVEKRYTDEFKYDPAEVEKRKKK